jgi:hypothetical protein
MKRVLVFSLFTAAAFGQGADVKFTGSLRTRVEAWDWFQGAAENTYPFLGALLRLSLSQTTRRLDWQVEAAAPLLLGLPDNAIAAGAQGQMGLGASYYAANQERNAAGLFPKQAWVRVKFAHGQSVRLGRVEFIDGNEVTPKNATVAALKRDRIAHRLLGNFGFSHVGRSFDGAQYTVSGSRTNLTLFGARPTRGVFQTDGWGELNANVFYGALTGQTSRTGSGEWRIFGLGYSDYRDGVVKTDNRPLAARRADAAHIDAGTYGGHVLQTAGPVDLLFWGVLQSGSWGALQHRAYAFAAEAGWQPGGAPKVRPWLRGGVDCGSGDKDPNDATHGTFFQVLPTPRIYARFPFFNMMNSRDVFGEAILRPGAKLTIRADVHRLDLTQKADLWYSGGGMFQPWTFGFTGRAAQGQSVLAMLYDASADYAASANLFLSFYFGHAAGSEVIKAIYPQGADANFGYVEATWRF